jgi:hypothetical protein
VGGAERLLFVVIVISLQVQKVLREIVVLMVEMEVLENQVRDTLKKVAQLE